METDYRLDTHFGSGSVRHTLSPDRLVLTYEKSGRTEEIPFSTITRLNPRHDMAGVYALHVHRRAGRTLAIPSRHFVGLGRFEDRSADYRAFVHQLHARVAVANPEARFVAGSSVLFWLGVLVLVLVAVMGAMVAFGVLVQGRSAPPLRVFAVVPLGLMVGGGFIAQGRSRSYDPGEIPSKVMPPAGTSGG